MIGFACGVIAAGVVYVARGVPGQLVPATQVYRLPPKAGRPLKSKNWATGGGARAAL